MKDKTMFKNNDTAQGLNAIEAPAVVEALLDGASLDGDMQRSLNMFLSEQQPHEALMTLAVSAYRLANQFADSGMVALTVLKIEAERIIEEHIALEPEALVFDEIQEDLECMVKLYEVAAAFLQGSHAEIAGLCRILISQGEAHALIAEAFVEAATNRVKAMEAYSSDLYVNEEITPVEDIAFNQEEYRVSGLAPSMYFDNVIQFPTQN